MITRFLFLVYLVAATALSGQDYTKLPDWAAAAAKSADGAHVPADADQWVLLDRTEFAYSGDGEVRTHRFRLVRVLDARGTDAGVFLLMGLGGGASKVKKLKGWNLRPDGELEKLDSDNVVAVEKAGDSYGIDNTRMTGAALRRVVKGSFVAFESLQTFHDPTGPADIAFIMERNPIYRWELAAAKSGGWFTDLKNVGVSIDLRHFSPWVVPSASGTNQDVSASEIPALPRDEQAVPSYWDDLPRVEVRFLDPDLKGVPDLRTWDGIAAWMNVSYQAHASPFSIPGVSTTQDVAGLRAIQTWMSQELTYKQVYLTPERGYTPFDASEVVRRRYGDCKDLASCFIAAARGAGFKAFPALARIGEGHLRPDEPVHPGCFNHVIAAVKLEKTQHLPSEVVLPQGDFLLVDPTARFTPFGYLPEEHRGGRVLLCGDGAATWMAIPDAAIEPRRLEVKLSATLDAQGRLNGSVRLEETGDAAGLRAAALNRTPKAFSEYLLEHLIEVPTDGTVEVSSHGDPLDLTKAFEANVRIVHPRGGRISKDEIDLDALGIFRVIPGAIQVPGTVRHFPVEQDEDINLMVQADITLAARVAPFLPEKNYSGPFWDLSWSASATPIAEGTLLTLKMDRHLKPAYFGFGEQEKGVTAWLKYRKDARMFIDDALAFKMAP